jgi:hypothetical protein
MPGDQGMESLLLPHPQPEHPLQEGQEGELRLCSGSSLPPQSSTTASSVVLPTSDEQCQ